MNAFFFIVLAYSVVFFVLSVFALYSFHQRKRYLESLYKEGFFEKSSS